MRRILLPLAAILVSSPMLFSQDVFELHGYTRAGVGRSTNGGEQVTFYLANTGCAPTDGPGYRLGNETDNYLELAMDVRAYEKGATSFKLHFRPTFRSYYSARDASEDAGGQINSGWGITGTAATENQEVFLRESWGEATGVFGKGNPFENASLWVGRRFYQRQDLHIRDQWYWNNSGDGFGIENIDLGFGKLHVAFIQHDNGQVDATAGAPQPVMWGKANSGLQYGSTVPTVDIRVSDMSPWKGSSITLGFQYNGASAAAANQVSDSGGDYTSGAGSVNMNSGVQWSALWSQANVLGGDNKVYASWGDGSTFYNWYNSNNWTHDKWWTIMEMYYIKPVDRLEMQGVFEFRRQTQGGHNDVWTGVDNSSFANDWKKNDWFSAGVRPVFFFTSHFSVAAELGYDRDAFSNEPEARFLFKKTLAIQCSPQASFWSRPVLRLFVTNANWNHIANCWGPVDSGQFSTQGTTDPGHYQGKTMGTTYGAQVEAWW
jgi:maltoporin